MFESPEGKMIQMTTRLTTGERIAKAREASGLSQRALAKTTGIPQTRLSRIESGALDAKMNEVLALAWATGSSISELTGYSSVRERLVCAARASDNASMEAMRKELTHYLELDAYLEDQAVPQPA
jgi:transcriptional regulator with XRE-family HTH domain